MNEAQRNEESEPQSGDLTELLAIDDGYLEHPSWLSGGGADSGLNYCRSCADKEQKRYGDDCYVDGGWPTEHDTAPQCEVCNIPLAGDLIDGPTLHTEKEWHKWCAENG